MKKDNIKLSILWIFSFLVIIFMMTFSSHAASTEEVSYVIPYNMYTFINNNTYCYTYNDDIILAGINWNSDVANYNWDNYIAFPIEDNWNSYGEVQIRYLFNPRITYDVPDNFNFFSNGITITYDNTVVFDVLFNSPIQPFEFSSWGSGGSGSMNVCGGFLPSDHGDGSVQRFYPFALSDSLYDSNGDVIFAWIESPTVQTGHATPPGIYDDPVVNSGSNHTLPREVPEAPVINNYSWTIYNPPAIDTSSVLNAIESLGDKIDYNWEYFKENLHGEFSVIINNLNSFFTYIGETIQYYGGLIISNIQNAIDTFYNNMVSLFEPIANAISYISEPVSGSVIYDNISTTSLVSNIGTIQTSLTSFQAAFTGVNEPSSYSIPIHLENLPSNWFGTQTTQYIDLGVINGTVKDGLRLFVWAMVTYSLVVTIFDSISNYINGGGDES